MFVGSKLISGLPSGAWGRRRPPATLEELILDLLIVTPHIQPVWENRLTVEWEGGTLGVEKEGVTPTLLTHAGK